MSGRGIPPQPTILPLIQAYAAVLTPPVAMSSANGGPPAPLVELASRVAARPRAKRLLGGDLADSDMVDVDVSERLPPQLSGRGGDPRGERLSEGLVRAALALPTLRRHAAMAEELEYSMRRRAPLWTPAILAILDELALDVTPTLERLLAAWFVLVHLSAPIDHWIDDDTVAGHWSRLHPAERFEVVFALKDEALAAPYETGVTPAMARAVTELASSTFTAAVGAYFDIAGALEVRRPGELASRLYLHEKLVHWKAGCIYRTLATLLAVAAEATPAQRQAIEEFGFTVGCSIQVLDDAGGIWGGGGDLARDRIILTFPLLYALAVPARGRDELAELLVLPQSSRNADRLLALLAAVDSIGFLEFLIERGRQRCAESLAPLHAETAERLLAWTDRYFRRAV